MASSNGGSGSSSEGLVIVAMVLVAVLLFVFVRSSGTAGAGTQDSTATTTPSSVGNARGRPSDETRYDHINVTLAPLPPPARVDNHQRQPERHAATTTVGHPYSPPVAAASAPTAPSEHAIGTSPTAYYTPPGPQQEPPKKKDLEFFVQKMRTKIANITSVDSPASLLILYNVAPVPANVRFYDNQAYKKLSAKISRLQNVTASGNSAADNSYDDVYFRLFHQWENTVSKNDRMLLKYLPLEDNIHNAWFSVAMREDSAQCSNVSVNLNQLTNRMFKCVARLMMSAKGEEKTIVKLLLAFFQVYSIVLLHEDCCSIGAAVARDRDASETLKSAFGQTLFVLSQRVHRVYRNVPSVLVALALLLRNDVQLLEQITRLVEREGGELLPRLLYGSQLLLHPLTVTGPSFMRDSSYIRNDQDILSHLHVDRNVVSLSVDLTTKLQTTHLDTWFATWSFEQTKRMLVQINEFLHPLPHVRVHELSEEAHSWPDAGCVRLQVETDQTADIRRQNLVARRMSNSDDTRCSATNEIYICQKSKLFSLSSQTDGLSSAQRFSSQEHNVAQDVVVNCFFTYDGLRQPTIVLNLLVTSKWLEQPDANTASHRSSAFLFDLRQLRGVTPENAARFHLLSADSPSSTETHGQLVVDTTTIVSVPAYETNNNQHLLRIDDQHEQVFVKLNQPNNNTSSIFFRVGQHGELQLVVIQRLDEHVAHQLENRITIGFGDQVYGTTTKAFDRKVRNRERTFLQNEVLDYKTLDEYSNSTKRNCLNFMYA